MISKEYLVILNELQKHHALFSEFWSVGSLVENTNIPTAAIAFDNIGKGLYFTVNPEFWNSLSLEEKTFVICHECLHMYFGHGARFLALVRTFSNESKQLIVQLANIAADIVVNHYLIDAFKFNRNNLKFNTLQTDTIKGVDALCWLDTIFPGDQSILPQQHMEYYFHKLYNPNTQSVPSNLILDDHSSITDDSNGVGDNLVDRITRRLSYEELSNFKELLDTNTNEHNESQKSQQAGSMAGSFIKRIKLDSVVKKKKWETVIKDVLGRYTGKEQDVIIEQWAHHSRRLASLSTDLLLPSDLDELVHIKDRIDVWFFLDTSGSCSHLAERFFRAAASIPEDRFKVRGFCFDTNVYEVNFREGELRGFGGTDFKPIEEEIQYLVRTEKCQYPQAVFLITDGAGSYVHPQYPDRWHWFLTKFGYRGYIPSTSPVYHLSDFE